MVNNLESALIGIGSMGLVSGFYYVYNYCKVNSKSQCFKGHNITININDKDVKNSATNVVNLLKDNEQLTKQIITNLIEEKKTRSIIEDTMNLNHPGLKGLHLKSIV